MCMLREASYGGLQWGLYTPIKNAMIGDGGREGSGGGFLTKTGAALLSGALSSSFVAPIDQLMLRQYTDGGRIHPVTGLYTTGLRKGHAPSAASSSLEQLRKIHDEEGGLRAVFRGASVTVVRAAIITVGLAVGYDQTKEELRTRLGMPEGVVMHVIGSVNAAVAASFACAPFDVIKTRLMATPERYPNGVVDVLAHALRTEGPRSLFLGVGANIVRLGPSTIIYLPILEEMRRLAGLKYIGE